MFISIKTIVLWFNSAVKEYFTPFHPYKPEDFHNNPILFLFFCLLITY